MSPRAPSGADRDWENWFSKEVHCHDSMLRTYLHNAFPSVPDVEDVVQESYLRIWKNRAAQPIRSAKAFLFTVARRLALDHVRRARRSPFVAAEEREALFVPDEKPNALEAAVAVQDVELLVQAIESLPAKCRAIFVLCHVEGLGHREIALRLGIAEGTVAVQSARGLRRCSQFLRACATHHER